MRAECHASLLKKPNYIKLPTAFPYFQKVQSPSESHRITSKMPSQTGGTSVKFMAVLDSSWGNQRGRRGLGKLGKSLRFWHISNAYCTDSILKSHLCLVILGMLHCRLSSQVKRCRSISQRFWRAILLQRLKFFRKKVALQCCLPWIQLESTRIRTLGRENVRCSMFKVHSMNFDKNPSLKFWLRVKVPQLLYKFLCLQVHLAVNTENPWWIQHWNGDHWWEMMTWPAAEKNMYLYIYIFIYYI